MKLRVWPGVVAVSLLWLLFFVVPRFAPSLEIVWMIGALVSALAVIVWWLFFSRVPWLERLAALALIVLALIAFRPIIDASIVGGAMGMLLYMLAVPVMTLALVVGAVVSRRASTTARRLRLASAILIGCAVFTSVRTGGITSGGGSDLHWRWTPTPEDRLLAHGKDDLPPAPAPESKPTTPAAEPAAAAKPEPPTPTKPAEWPGFRGPSRDGIVHGVSIGTDWSQTPPVLLWKRPIGPGWSSFAVDGDLLYTQEQRGGEEIVGCYRVSTGAPVWRHRDPVRFYESNGGAGPRGTPTLKDGRVYALGATGILNVLHARTGAMIWSRNIASDTKSKTPFWGFSSSPLVVDDVVIVAASSKLAAYDVTTGDLRWSDPSYGGSYSSPHLITIDGVPQILMLSGSGATSVSPSTGKILWQHAWQDGGTTIVQPAQIDDHDVIITTAGAMGGAGVRRLAIARGSNGWKVDVRWTSPGLKPYFNDYVLHKGNAYGFDGSILSCVDLADGSRKWKGGRYGSGQLVLLADQDLLLVTSEEGELALVSATPDQFKEFARIPGIEGKTWNHPVVVRDVLLVRNGEEMAAFKLPMASK